MADLLIIDEIGKEISGSGPWTPMSSAASGAFKSAPPENQPEMRFHFLSAGSRRTRTATRRGSGSPIFTTARLVDSMKLSRDGSSNCVTSGLSRGGELAGALRHRSRGARCGGYRSSARGAAEKARIMHIRNTMTLHEVEVSEPWSGGIATGDTVRRCAGGRMI